MKDNANDKSSSQAGPLRISPSEFNRRLTMLRAEVNLDFPGLIQELESGTRVILVTDRELGNDLNPDALRRVGGMTILCSYYGTAVVFVNERKIAEFGGGNKED